MPLDGRSGSGWLLLRLSDTTDRNRFAVAIAGRGLHFYYYRWTLSITSPSGFRRINIMKIIIVSQTYSNGNGQASFTIQLAESLAQRGNQVMVITPSNQLRPVSCIQNGVRVEVIPALHASLIHPYIYVTPFPAFQIRKLMREFQPDVVHIQDHYLLCNSAVNEAHKMNIPVIGTNHFLPENLLPFLIKFPNLQYLLSFPLWKMMLAVFNKLDLATTPTETAARILRKQQIHVPVRAISNGVDTERFHPDPQA